MSGQLNGAKSAGLLIGAKMCNYGTGIVFTGNMLSWLSFHNFV